MKTYLIVNEFGNTKIIIAINKTQAIKTYNENYDGKIIELFVKLRIK